MAKGKEATVMCMCVAELGRPYTVRDQINLKAWHFLMFSKRYKGFCVLYEHDEYCTVFLYFYFFYIPEIKIEYQYVTYIREKILFLTLLVNLYTTDP